MNKKIKINNVNIDALSLQETVELVNQYVIQKKPLHLMGVNADKINQMKRNSKLARIVNSCAIINADGASVVLASKFLKTPLPERVAGIDLMDHLVKLASNENYSVFLLGAKQQVVKATALKLVSKYPNLNIVGIHDGYFSTENWLNIAKILKEKKPNFVFVGISSPMKEYLIDYLQKEGINSVFMGVGGSFDVISGMIKRAPLWVQKINMEWFYRMIQEPKRLVGRYMIGNFLFIKGILSERVENGKNRR